MRFTTTACALLLTGSCLLPSAAKAALQSGTGTIANLRIEGNYAFIGLAQPLPAPCGNRVWVDMTSQLGRAVYATALVAFNAKQPVTIRGKDDNLLFSACGLYDIYVAQ